MRHVFHIAMLLGFALASATAAMPPGQPTAVVNSARVNVRGQASLNSEIITQLNPGEVVTILATLVRPASGSEPASRWQKILLPSDTPVWVYAPSVDRTTFTVRRPVVSVRAGPGRNFSVIGSLPQGSTVNALRTLDDWIEIEPPANTFAFVAAQFLDVQTPATGALPGMVSARTTPKITPPADVVPAISAATPTASSPVSVPLTRQTAPAEAPVVNVLAPATAPTTASQPAPPAAPVEATKTVATEPPATTPTPPPAIVATPPAPATPKPTSADPAPPTLTVVKPPPPAKAEAKATPATTKPTPAAAPPSATPKAVTLPASATTVPPPPPSKARRAMTSPGLPPHKQIHHPSIPVTAADPDPQRKKRVVAREGRVVRTSSIQAPTPFELQGIDGRNHSLNWLLPATDTVNLHKYLGQHVIVVGEEQMEPRWKFTPMIVVESVKLAP